MPDRKRAAQFMPFNGLRGYAEQVTAAQIRRAQKTVSSASRICGMWCASERKNVRKYGLKVTGD